MSNYHEKIQQLVIMYRESGEKWPAASKELAAWAIQNKLWAPRPADILNECAEHFSRALRDEYVTDAQGRRVRTKHAATYDNGSGQLVLWDDIRTATTTHMKTAFQQRRHQILGDCKQLKNDVDSFNENRKPEQPINLIFDFTLDLAEAELAKKAA